MTKDSIKEYEREAYERGQADFYRGLQLDQNPYSNDRATHASSEWECGWRNEKEIDDNA